ncbi:restriction endonuclease [Lacihabitans sp. CCS-44]|uniref:restriction endonuclease n=1 Tax=Lacihabitans sp. CCS-44 TaxID=2487331 RepID=UPI0020CD0ABA|nr:restriction endonuclease [Lacihabitans sp. CCS-44]
MEEYYQWIKYEIGTKCSVECCTNPAKFEVVLYDFYKSYNETFYEQDYTCPFLCEEHLEMNESQAVGERIPRGHVDYPFTNKHGAQGYSKYNPIKDVYPKLFSSEYIEDNKEIQVDLNEINDELIAYLAKHPEYLSKLHHRKFEELIAEIIRSKGFDVTLTPKTRDGGKDIIALYKSPFGHQMFIVECKKYGDDNKVGVELVRGLYGVKVAERYNQAILVTTSTFTKGAKEFVKPLNFELELKDYNDISNWCKEYKK